MGNLYTLRVYPKGEGRKVYRVLQITGDMTLDDLCWEILESFDFDNDHMYEFCMDNRPYRGANYICYSEEGEPTTDIALDDIGLYPGQKFTFHFDFGDDWLFPITVQKISRTDEEGYATVIQEKGHIEQYPSYDEEEDEDEDD